MEAFGGRIIFQCPGIGIRKVSGGIHVSHQNVRHGKSAFHSALECQKRTLNALVVGKPSCADHTAHVQNHDHLPETALDCFDHGFFSIGQLEVTVFENAGRNIGHLLFGRILLILILVDHSLSVPAFSGKTADGNDGRIRKRCRPRKKFFRYGRLNGESRHGAFRKLLFYVFLIKPYGLRIDKNLSFFLLQGKTLGQISDIGAVDVSGTASAFYVIDGSFSEQSDAFSLFQRKDLLLIFKKDHSFSCCPSGKCDMFI